MFELPNAERVRRSDLFSFPSTSPSPDPSRSASPHQHANAAALLRARLDELYRYPGPDVPPDGADEPAAPRPRQAGPAPERRGKAEPDVETAYDFPLFSAPGPRATASRPQIGVDEEAVAPPPAVTGATTEQQRSTLTQRVVLSSPSPSGSGTFLTPRRPLSHYLTSAAPPAARSLRAARFRASALSGADILALSHALKYPGCNLPWRVSATRPGRSTLRALSAAAPDGPHLAQLSGTAAASALRKGRRTKPNKKRRVALRTRARQLERKKEERTKAEEEREKEERAKRTRRNREKKVKRKVREKAKRAGETEAGQGGQRDQATGFTSHE